MLFRHRKSLDETHVQRYLLILYQGLKNKVFYWELVNTIRKILMISVNVLMSTQPLIYSATTAVIILVILLRIQIRLQPYKLDYNNKLEIEAVITGTATLFAGVLFITENDEFAELVLVILMIVIMFNIKFFLLWLLCMTSTVAHKHEFFRSFYNMLSIVT